MGTRHLIAVQIDREYKIAQYGQWDGYPSGQGIDILDFLRTVDLVKFSESVRATRYLTQEQLRGIDEAYKGKWPKVFPHLSRDCGSEILDLVYNGTVELKNSISFAGDSLFCEYGYIIDLDKGVLEIYKGFNEEPIINSRFNSMDKTLDKSEGYGPIKLVKTYQLGNLPSDELFIPELEKFEENKL